MKSRARSIGAAILCGALSLLARASADGLAPPDGKFYVRPDVTRPGEPFQRALLVHDRGKELLLIQPMATGTAAEFGWVVPVPSAPSVGSIDAVRAEQLFMQLAHQTRPHVRSIRAAATIFTLIVTVLLVFVSLLSGKGRGTAFSLLAIALLTTFVFTPQVLGGSVGVEVVEGGRAGIYDTNIVRSDHPRALREWLDANGFAASAEDERAFAEHIARGWNFVTAKVAASAAAEPSSDGLLQPLALLFDAEKPVYPFALTATAGHAVEVLLYVAADQRQDCPPLGVEAVVQDWRMSGPGRTEPSGPPILWPVNVAASVDWKLGKDREPSRERFGRARWLTKLRAVIEPGEVEADLVCTPHTGGAYRQTVWR